MERNPQAPYEQMILYSGDKKLLALESYCVGYRVFAAYLEKEQIKFE